MRDAYPHLVMKIEDRRREQYAAAIPPMRAALMAMNDWIEADLRDYPSTTGWIRRPWSD